MTLVLSLLLLTAPQAQAEPKKEPMAVPAQAAPVQDARVISLGKSRLTFYGFLRLDTMYDTDRPNNVQTPVYILSDDSTVVAEDNSAGENAFSMHPRLTRLGIDIEGEPIGMLGDVKLTGKLEVDFYNLPGGITGTGNSNSRQYLRLRHAWGKLDWGTFNVLFGQTQDVMSPLNPTPNNDMVMWGAGNPGDRRPQFRPELKWEGLTLTVAAGVTGAADSQNLDGAGSIYFDGEASGLPTVQGRAGYEFEAWVEKKKINLGLSGTWAREELEVPLGGKEKFTSSGYCIDVTIPITSQLWIKAEYWAGRNLDDVRGGIFQGVASTGQEIDAAGGWVELGYQITSWWTPVLGYSVDNPDDHDLGPASATYFPRSRNQIYYIANRMRFGSLEIGADYLNWTTDYDVAGAESGTDHRFNVFFAFHF